ncbi:MAG TPA: hypothetical protein VIQ03_10625 [Gammaproteobacteria bacterium]
MKPLQANLFINNYEHNSILKKLRKSFSGKPEAKWVIVTRSEYIRLQAMQGLLLLILLGLSGVMLG